MAGATTTLSYSTRSTAPPTQTIGACEVYHKTHTALKLLINGVHTKEDLDELLQGLDELWRIKAEEAHSALIHDPPIIQQKGHPQWTMWRKAISEESSLFREYTSNSNGFPGTPQATQCNSKSASQMWALSTGGTHGRIVIGSEKQIAIDESTTEDFNGHVETHEVIPPAFKVKSVIIARDSQLLKNYPYQEGVLADEGWMEMMVSGAVGAGLFSLEVEASLEEPIDPEAAEPIHPSTDTSTSLLSVHPLHQHSNSHSDSTHSAQVDHYSTPRPRCRGRGMQTLGGSGSGGGGVVLVLVFVSGLKREGVNIGDGESCDGKSPIWGTYLFFQHPYFLLQWVPCPYPTLHHLWCHSSPPFPFTLILHTMIIKVQHQIFISILNRPAGLAATNEESSQQTPELHRGWRQWGGWGRTSIVYVGFMYGCLSLRTDTDKTVAWESEDLEDHETN
ncbi:hypothetical protein EDB19DRAFT_1835755 [Suillus lakei]|nr:hypothetical protein EDB19DRAFT_1835755 [Suillus lakei]